jgi:hypothetical protein
MIDTGYQTCSPDNFPSDSLKEKSFCRLKSLDSSYLGILGVGAEFLRLRQQHRRSSGFLWRHVYIIGPSQANNLAEFKILDFGSTCHPVSKRFTVGTETK